MRRDHLQAASQHHNNHILQNKYNNNNNNKILIYQQKRCILCSVEHKDVELLFLTLSLHCSAVLEQLPSATSAYTGAMCMCSVHFEHTQMMASALIHSVMRCYFNDRLINIVAVGICFYFSVYHCWICCQCWSTTTTTSIQTKKLEKKKRTK